jgi:hypothetical protein
LTSDHVVVTVAEKYFHRLLHIENDGRIHCSNSCTPLTDFHYHFVSRSIMTARLCAWFDWQHQVVYQKCEQVNRYRGGYWGRECTERLTHCEDTDVNVCVRRAILLHSIRERNRHT